MGMHRWRMVAAATTGALLAWACGSSGNDNGDLVGTGDGGASSSGSTSSSGAASGSSSGSSGTDGATSSGAVGGDGGVNPPNAGPGGTTTAINCGATSCSLATDVCCVSQVQGGLAYSCAASAAGCPANDAGGGGDNNVATLKCSSQANCAAGTVCCVTQTTAGASSECKASCGNNEEQLCDPKAADGGGCAPAKPCSNDGVGDFGLPKTFGICGGG